MHQAVSANHPSQPHDRIARMSAGATTETAAEREGGSLSFRRASSGGASTASPSSRAASMGIEPMAGAPGGAPSPTSAVIKQLVKDFGNGLDPDRLTGADADRVYRDVVETIHVLCALKARLSRRIEESGVWSDAGESSCASYLASVDGVSRGEGRATLEVGRALSEFSLLDETARDGQLSQAKLTELTSTLRADPEAEATIVPEATSETLWMTKERCQRVRATSARRDPVATARRTHAGRHLTWWADSEGAFCFQGRDTADRGAQIRDRIDQLASELRRDRAGEDPNAEAPRESDGALRADALFLLLADSQPIASRERSASRPLGASARSPESAGHRDRLVRSSGGKARRDPASTNTDDRDARTIVDRPPRCNVMVRVDLEALRRGHARPGECCEIDGHGPIPVPMARDLANDSFLRVVFHQAGDIRAVSTFGRTVKRHLRIALAARDRCCVVPGCGATQGLEIDHVVPFSEGGPTELDNLALLCHHHHFLKTFDGWRLSRSPNGESAEAGTWRFEPPIEPRRSAPRSAERRRRPARPKRE